MPSSWTAVSETPLSRASISATPTRTRSNGSIADGREGLKSLETLIAIYLSARDGRRVPLPLDL